MTQNSLTQYFRTKIVKLHYTVKKKCNANDNALQIKIPAHHNIFKKEEYVQKFCIFQVNIETNRSIQQLKF